MPEPEFDPRRAALNHAGLAERALLDLHLAAAAEDEGRVISASVRAYADGVHAIACGLVYVGDQIRALSDVGTGPDRATLGDLAQSIDNIAP